MHGRETISRLSCKVYIHWLPEFSIWPFLLREKRRKRHNKTTDIIGLLSSPNMYCKELRWPRLYPTCWRNPSPVRLLWQTWRCSDEIVWGQILPSQLGNSTVVDYMTQSSTYWLPIMIKVTLVIMYVFFKLIYFDHDSMSAATPPDAGLISTLSSWVVVPFGIQDPFRGTWGNTCLRNLHEGCIRQHFRPYDEFSTT